MDSIGSISNTTPVGAPGLKPASTSSDNGASFKNLFAKLVDETNTNLIDADKTVKDFVQGKTDNPHDVMIRLEEAHLSLQYTVQLRNKVVEAYQELMRMQI